MTKNSITGEWYASKENVKGVLSGKSGRTGWTINFEELSRITNGHPEFLEKVKAFTEMDLGGVYKAAVYRSFSDDHHGNKSEHIAIVFDVVDTYIKILSCRVDHEQQPHVFETSFNKSYVWSMATML
ncbi:hypothetical protein WJ0W_007128 [Paenibacillus melissococcoides]|uniref:Uncharacterized protein n=1 Tax=Paenibacillus melissococcoides TaxID=2912268 RepID=A0ABN8UBL7_9BACL|nr:hypothetical protein [Paenibacillus melissococcoides]CAH8248460.1 hypothetical protein WJ0W_007128 [Paenibacillus melissococcoides]CAH8722039.1 hypothetical protein HTL2_006662 [Paenibacillus melissococcoides]CAH8722148.1 hypothetical protein WDD9_006651 [Paenibacillus melissococcoides]